MGVCYQVRGECVRSDTTRHQSPTYSVTLRGGIELAARCAAFSLQEQ